MTALNINSTFQTHPGQWARRAIVQLIGAFATIATEYVTTIVS